MNILLVITKSEIGGAQVFVLNLARALKNAGHNVEVVAGDGDYLFEELDKSNIKYHFFNSLKRNFSIIKSLLFVVNLHKLLKSNNYDILHLNSSNTLLGALSARFLRKRPQVVFTFHGLSFLDENFGSNTFIKKIAKLYFKSLLIFVDKFAFVSKLNSDVAKKEKIVSKGKIIYNGINEKELDYQSRNQAREFLSKFGVPGNGYFIIGSIGRLAYQKNYEFLINNFQEIKKHIPNAKIVIIGDGPDFTKLQEMIKKYNFADDIFLTGAIKNSYMYLKAFDVFTLPSRYEGLSISLIEALYANVPVLVSDVGGNPEMVNQKQLFKLDDSKQFLDRLLALKENENFDENEYCRYKELFNLDNMLKEYLMLYKGL